MALYVAVDCKNCGRRILDTVYAQPGVIAYRLKDRIRCGRCGQEEQYDGPDFKIVEGPDLDELHE
jgi:DNA-directed RNA polymerase subunit RPC12/RpoP